jgi:glycerophosphoryl diester phosphodiesterase
MTDGAGLQWQLGPVAHRGLHDGTSIIENTASAFTAAIDAGYAIETDVQLAAGNESVIFHDETLDRMTQATGEVIALGPKALKRIPLRGTDDRILTLSEFLELVAGRVPIFLEIKTAWNGRDNLEQAIAAQLARYQGPIAVMSFDPASVKTMGELIPTIPRGLVSMRFTKNDWPKLDAWRRFRLTHLLDFRSAKPDFLAYHIKDLPRLPITILRRRGLPVLTWTVRNEEQRRKASEYADAIIFETLRPDVKGQKPNASTS